MIKGYLTVYLTLIMTVVLSLCLTLIEGTRANAIRVESECVAEIGFNSVLAEYHRELFTQYNLFAIDSSYGTSISGTEVIIQHLQEYLDRNFGMEEIFLEDFLYKDFLAISVESIEMTGASILTDEGGAVFRKHVIEAIQDDYNLTLLQDVQQWMQVVEAYSLWDRDVASEKRIADESLQKYNGQEIQISETERKIIQIDNPTVGLEQIRREGILKYVVGDASLVSTKAIDTSLLIGSRMEGDRINKGNLLLKEAKNVEELWERFFFQEYLLKYMGHCNTEKEKSALSYQIEYLIAGNDTDVANLKNTVNLLLAVREAANAVYLFADKEKCAEVEEVSLFITTLLGVPEAASALKTVILLGWTFAESMYDVESLLAGGRIPLLKDKTTWHFDMQSAMQYGNGAESSDASVGLSYEDYLRLFMMFVDLDTLTKRAMDMVEADIRLTPGNHFFRLDNCYAQVEFCIGVNSRYGYQYEITRRKGY